MKSSVTKLLNIEYPIIQAGMVWCSGWRLASASSNSGILGVIGSGSMYPEVLVEHIKKCRKGTTKPFAVNLPLLYPQIDDHIKSIIDLEVPIVITSAGNPAKYTALLKSKGITVLHVVSSSKFAIKAMNSGVDAVICEGFEAGGHNGREETTSFCLIPEVANSVSIPVIAAGGIATGRSMLAAMTLGADGVQVGTRFVTATESSAHSNFKEAVVQAKEGSTELTLKELTPVRLLKNSFYDRVIAAYERGAGKEELKELLGRGRAKKGMFEGDLDQGELEIGQISSQVNRIMPVHEIVEELIDEFKTAQGEVSRINL